jgi:hypothetical protein
LEKRFPKSMWLNALLTAACVAVALTLDSLLLK